ncbi:hypothetical protein [Paenibacillus montanisoli]|uniref:Aldose 1-epimerase n=1 Tax=Paenibacillus montanisoli TaxID=2081970 RepID=A0A328TW68_9BACL|nr:hypothetical protein [Paenibacillus montanisoli]RAP74590.1 hypothetical protein DL346_21255 [Paenibacillus montanisoli]
MIRLSNDQIEVRLDTPGEHYKGTRFDRSAYLYAISCNEISFAAHEFPDRPIGTGGAGLCSEFAPLGFEETEIGDWFVKPGVGLLKKESESYIFHKQYECLPDAFEVVQHGPASVTLSSDGQEADGRRLRISRTFTLTGDGVVIDYTLVNLGSKTIHTEEYVHNFIAIQQQPIGSGYSFQMDAAVDSDRLPPFIQEADGQLRFTDAPKEPFYFRAEPAAGDDDVFELCIHYEDIGGFLEIDWFVPSKVAVWGCPHALSVESFNSIELQPGERIEYRREFKLACTPAHTR